jgi:fatty acid desaturase
MFVKVKSISFESLKTNTIKQNQNEMKAHTASLLNAILLITLSLWGYFSSDSPSFTALIPTIIGAILLFLNKGVKNENKVIAHIAVLLTLLVLFGLIKPLMGALDRDDNLALIRVVVMMLSTVLAMVFFVKSFIDARKNRVEE